MAHFRYILTVAALGATSALYAQSAVAFYLTPAKTMSSYITAGIASQDAAAACRPGDIEIGRQETADEIIVYCSRVSCDLIAQRVGQDLNAQRTLQHAIEENNADLKLWGQQNEAARKAALKDAADTLIGTLQAFSANQGNEKIARLQSDLNRRASEGAATAAKLEKVRAFASAYAEWNGLSGGLKSDVTSGTNAADTWVELQKWADNARKKSTALNSTWAALSADPEVREMLKGENLDQALNALNWGLKPVLSGTFDLDKFLSQYGYDASKWQVSKQNILLRNGQTDTNQLAECKLDRLMKIDVRNMNVCRGRLPDPNAPDPEEIRCVAAK
jgi:hypothetical protein